MAGGGYTTPLFSDPFGSADDTYNFLARTQWADIVKNVFPYQDKLIQYATDPQVVRNAQSQASTDVNASFDRQQSANNDRIRSLGLTLTPEEQQVSTRLTGLSKSLASAQATNQAGLETQARQQAILGSAAPTFGKF